MPIRIKSRTTYQGTASPSALNTETDIINLASQTDAYIVEGQIDLVNLASGDAVTLKVYIAVDGTNQRLTDSQSFSGAQSIPVVRVPAHTILSNGKFRVTITQTAGTTLKAFPYSFIMELMEEI
jgi:hypothetical protein